MTTYSGDATYLAENWDKLMPEVRHAYRFLGELLGIELSSVLSFSRVDKWRRAFNAGDYATCNKISYYKLPDAAPADPVVYEVPSDATRGLYPDLVVGDPVATEFYQIADSYVVAMDGIPGCFIETAREHGLFFILKLVADARFAVGAVIEEQAMYHIWRKDLEPELTLGDEAVVYTLYETTRTPTQWIARYRSDEGVVYELIVCSDGEITVTPRAGE